MGIRIHGGRRLSGSYLISVVAAFYGVFLGTGVLIVLIAVAALFGGISLAEFFAALGKTNGVGNIQNVAIVALERIIWLGYVLACVGFARGAIKGRIRRRLLGG